MNTKIKKLLLHILSEKTIFFIRQYRKNIFIKNYQKVQEKRYEKTLTRLRNKEKVRVAFFIETHAMWKLDALYWLMEKSKEFEPVIVICPWMQYEKKNRHILLDQVEIFCINKQYNYINTYNKNTEKWLNIKKIISPDIIFFKQPYDTSRKEYSMKNFMKTSLICYASYSFFLISNQQNQFNLLFHNLMWKGFCETSVHKTMSEKYAYNRGVNVEWSGCPFVDDVAYIKQTKQVKNVWKIHDRKIKRIIWAPHHRIFDHSSQENGINWRQYSCFPSYSSFMLHIAEKYKDQIQIAFKPHPRLKLNLYKHIDWGISKTDEYYGKWENLENGQLEEGAYIDLFLTSDAMILDSISFMCEYLCTDNPLLYTVLNKDIEQEGFNEFGKMVFEKIYHAYSQKQTEIFINEVILNEKDELKNERMQFFNTYLLPPNNVSASQNIFNSIINAMQ